MHLLKHLTVWGLCAVMLGTQPVSLSADSVSTQDTAVYSADTSTAKKEKSDASSEDSSTETSSSEETSDSSPETDTSESTEETSSSTEETTASSSETTASSTEQSTEQTETASSSTKAEDASTTTVKKQETESTASTGSASTENTSSTKKNKKKSAESTTEETVEEKELKKLDDTIIDEEDSAEKEEDPAAVIPKIYGSSQITTRDDAEYMGDFVYFNQTDSIWNQNGYRIAAAGCGPTSMAVVISSLTDEWVTPVDTTVWAYEHGYYSSAGSSHSLIPALSEAYGLKCKGAGTDYETIKTALQKGKPVVALMGPGYFTRKGHFMVLIGIDENDNVTVADVGSRQRSSYKYALSDIISQSKSASAGGPFWVISKPKEKKESSAVSYSSPQNDYVLHIREGEEEKTITFHLGDKVSYNGTYGLIVKFENRKAYVLSENNTYITTQDGGEAIPLSDLQIVKTASSTVYTAVSTLVEKEISS